jgi:hypothetical protein
VSLNHTTDGGSSWHLVLQPPTIEGNWGYYVKTKVISPKHFTIITTVNDDIVRRVYGTICTFIGDSVYVFGDPVTTYYIRFLAVDFADELHGTVVGTNGTIYQTDDGGRSWHLEYCPTNLQLEAVSMPQAYITSTSGIRGIILRRSNTDPLASVAEASTNSSFEIVSTYPNPARDASTLIVRLSRPMPLEVRIFSELGAELKVFDLGMMQEGEYELPLTLNSLSSGTYILEVRSSQEAKHSQLKILK